MACFKNLAWCSAALSPKGSWRPFVDLGVSLLLGPSCFSGIARVLVSYGPRKTAFHTFLQDIEKVWPFLLFCMDTSNRNRCGAVGRPADWVPVPADRSSVSWPSSLPVRASVFPSVNWELVHWTRCTFKGAVREETGRRLQGAEIRTFHSNCRQVKSFCNSTA